MEARFEEVLPLIIYIAGRHEDKNFELWDLIGYIYAKGKWKQYVGSSGLIGRMIKCDIIDIKRKHAFDTRKKRKPPQLFSNLIAQLRKLLNLLEMNIA